MRLFDGPAYKGLSAEELEGEKDLSKLHNGVVILSGLYGFLRAMDSIQPYRLDVVMFLGNYISTISVA